jgi:hypothetical protein
MGAPGAALGAGRRLHGARHRAGNRQRGGECADVCVRAEAPGALTRGPAIACDPGPCHHGIDQGQPRAAEHEQAQQESTKQARRARRIDEGNPGL